MTGQTNQAQCYNEYMKKFLLLFASSCLLSVPLFAQALVEAGIKGISEVSLNNTMRRAVALNIPLLPKVADTGLHSFQISKILKTRLWDSFGRACSLQATISECHAMIYGEPVYDFVADKPFSPGTLYPQVNFLKTSKQAQNYMLARNNRLFAQEVARLNQTIWPILDKKLPALRYASEQLPQVLDPLGWMAQQVVLQNKKFLFIGEVHEFPEIQESVRQFLTTLRELAPTRPIIVLTEFLPAEYEWYLPEEFILPDEKRYFMQHSVPQYLQEDYRPIWDDIVQQNMRVIGLEPYRVLNDGSKIKYVSRGGDLLKQEMWTTLEGMRIRNEAWKKTIEKYRQENPEALLVVYTGAAHSLYTSPFSIVNGYEDDAFVLTFYPARRVFIKTDVDEQPVAATTSLTDPLERLTNFTQSFPQTVLFLDRPDLARVVGFDGRIKVEVDLQSRLKRLSQFTNGRIEEQ